MVHSHTVHLPLAETVHAPWAQVVSKAWHGQGLLRMAASRTHRVACKHGYVRVFAFTANPRIFEAAVRNVLDNNAWVSKDFARFVKPMFRLPEGLNNWLLLPLLQKLVPTISPGGCSFVTLADVQLSVLLFMQEFNGPDHGSAGAHTHLAGWLHLNTRARL